MILGLTEAGAVAQPIAVALSSEVDEVPTSSQTFAEWQEEQALLTLCLQQRVLPLRFPFSFPFPFENTSPFVSHFSSHVSAVESLV